jgi:hypothetical protein
MPSKQKPSSYKPAPAQNIKTALRLQIVEEEIEFLPHTECLPFEFCNNLVKQHSNSWGTTYTCSVCGAYRRYH